MTLDIVAHSGSTSKRIGPPVALVLAFYALFVPIRIHQFGILWFAHVGSYFRDQAHTSRTIDSFRPAESRSGYDGQFYLFIAADPAHARDYMRRSAGGDDAGRRYARILYPMVARVTALGRVGAIPWTLLATNLIAIGAGTLAFALWLVRWGRSPWFAVLYGLWPGMVFAVFRDLSEPLAYFFVAAALLAFDVRRARRVWVACALLALAGLTRETTIVFPLAGALALWLADRRPGRAVMFVAGSLLPMIVWRAVVTAWVHATTFEPSGGAKTVIPFYGLASNWPWNGEHWLIAIGADLPLLAAAGAAVMLLRRRESAPAAVALLLNVALFVIFIPRSVTIDFGAAYRNMVPALIGVLCCVPWWTGRRVTTPLAVLLSPLAYVVVAATAGLSPIALMIS